MKSASCVYVLLHVAPFILGSMREPVNVWPLGNVSLFNDVQGSQNIQHDTNNECFKFVDGPSGLPYTVLDVRALSTQVLDVTLKGLTTLRDITIAFYVYPENDPADITGTLLHYQSEDREFIRVRMLANTFLVSFRDEYGMSAGMMYLVDFLTPRAWNHVIISRIYSTGRIIVYKDGVNMYDMDDDFSNVISFPHGGKLRIGKSQDPDDDDVFVGNFACIQIYEIVIPPDIQGEVLGFCRPQNWNQQFTYYYRTENGQQCLTDPPPPEIDYSLVSMTTLTRGSMWNGFLSANGLQDSGTEAGYLVVLSRDQEPSAPANLIGSFNVTSAKVCARLCVRINGCVCTWTDGQGLLCNLYDSEPLNLLGNPGSKIYKIVV